VDWFQWEGEEVRKGYRRVNMVQILYTHVSKWKNDPVETISGIGGEEGERRMVEAVNSCMIYVIYCKNFGKCHNVPLLSTTMKNTKIKRK
jgi:hypothetical protein